MTKMIERVTIFGDSFLGGYWRKNRCIEINCQLWASKTWFYTDKFHNTICSDRYLKVKLPTWFFFANRKIMYNQSKWYAMSANYKTTRVSKSYDFENKKGFFQVMTARILLTVFETIRFFAIFLRKFWKLI